MSNEFSSRAIDSEKMQRDLEIEYLSRKNIEILIQTVIGEISSELTMRYLRNDILTAESIIRIQERKNILCDAIIHKVKKYEQIIDDQKGPEKRSA
ncbi:MAG: hypothetical protein ACD_5C00075G0011 [uncultured bacterium]|nr:MAG: hypothetical protein ACD_5C00075G0011 [uncultured bacterium]